MSHDSQYKRARVRSKFNSVARRHRVQISGSSKLLFKASWHEPKAVLQYSGIIAIANTKHCQQDHCGAEHIPETSSGGSRDHCDN